MPNRVLLAALLVACSSSDLGSNVADQADVGFRTVQSAFDLAAGDVHSRSLPVPDGATLLDVSISGAAGELAVELWDAQSGALHPCTGAGTTWTCVVAQPIGGDWGLDVIAIEDAVDVEVSWAIEGAGQQDLTLVDGPVPAGWSMDLAVPAALGHLRASLTARDLEIRQDGELLCRDRSCEVLFAENATYTVSAEGGGHVTVDWVAAPLLLDTAVSAYQSESIAFDVPAGVDRIVVQTTDGERVRLMRGAFELCSGTDRCSVDQPAAGSWSAVVEMGWRDGVVQVGAMGGAVAPAPTPEPPVPSTTGLRINEVLFDPTGMEDDPSCSGPMIDGADDEFIEIVNTSSFPIDLDGMTLEDTATVRHVFDEGSIVQPGGALVVFGGGTPNCAHFGDTPVQTASTGGLGLSNTGDFVWLIAADGTEMDRVGWSTGMGQNQSITRSPDVTGTTFVDHTTVSGAPASPAAYSDGTPFDPTAVPTGPQILINEIHADPSWENGDANCDGVADMTGDEFVELVNIATTPIDISDWTLSDSMAHRFSFPAGTLLQPGDAAVVYGGGTAMCPFPTTVHAFNAPGALSLGNGGDTVVLADATAQVHDSVSYGSEAASDVSIVRSPELDPNGTFVAHDHWFTSYSPGVRVDHTAF
jgi:hypothetical protein